MQMVPNYHDRITTDPAICHGQPVVRGLRYPVTFVLELLAAGMTDTEILADYEDLEAADLRACYAYAAERLKPQSPPPPIEEEPRAPARWMSRTQFKAYLQRIGQLPPDAEPGQ